MNGELAVGSSLSIYRSEELIKSFLEYADVKPTSETSYLKALKPLFRYLIAHDITEPTREDIKAYREELLRTKKETTVNLYMTTARLFFEWTERCGIYPNIAARLKGAKVSPEFKRDNLTSEQTKAVLQGIDTTTPKGKRDYALIFLAVTCGLRTVEIINADIKDLTVRGDRAVLYVKGKGRDGKDAYINVSAEADKVVRDYLKDRDNTEPDAPLFTSLSNSNSGGRLTTRSIRRIVKTRMRAVGLDSERLTAHSLRHTAATLAIKGGESTEDAQVFLRHKDIGTTMRYNHALDIENNNCSEAVTAAII